MTEMPRIGRSTCPHDCPSVCALDVEVLSPTRIGRVGGDKRHTYTAGIVCEKVGRYAERVHHKDRLLHPLRRKGPKGSGRFERISWDDALDGVRRGVVIVEGVQPNAMFPGGESINTLTSADPPAPYGGAAFHDNHVWIAPREE